MICDSGAIGEAFESCVARHSSTQGRAFLMVFFKKLLLWAIIGGILYFFLSYHIIYIDKSVKLLKKSELTLEYTFYSANLKTDKTVLSVDALREDGIGDLLVDMGRLSEVEMETLVEQIEEGYSY